MANSNVNIGSRLFAYIKHGVDLNENLTTQYKNSLIFIGDEERIYVPIMNTYVGIGRLAYSNTVNAINDVNSRIDDIAGRLDAATVSRIYTQVNENEWLNSIYDQLDKSVQTEIGIPENLTPFSMTQAITIKGIGDYDPATQLAYTHYNITLKDSQGNDRIVSVPVQRTDNGVYASSGITVSNYTGDATTNSDGTVTFGSNYVVIDDKLTWQHIDASYTYLLSFTQQYTASEIERVYRNILGEGESTYVPLDFEYVFSQRRNTISAADFNNLSAAEKANYMLDPATGNYIYIGSTDSKTEIVFNFANDTLYYKQQDANGAYTEILPDGSSVKFNWVQYSTVASDANAVSKYPSSVVYEGTTYDNVPQLYKLSTEYNSTYNMSIADGIQTLKEVAYILDILTDGAKTTSYITPDEYNALTAEEKATYSYDGATPETSTTFWRIEQDTENIGIQLAYSIASLNSKINDLHNHVDHLEDGETTLRSITMNGASPFLTVSMQGRQGVRTTDSNTELPNCVDNVTAHYNEQLGNTNEIGSTENWTGNSYLSGDTNIKLNLQLTQTYITNSTTGTGTLPNNYVVYDNTVYQKADMTSLTATANTYYTWDNTSMTAVAADNVVTNVNAQHGLQYWWISDANAVSGSFKNAKFTERSPEFVMNNPTMEYYEVTDNAGVKTYAGPVQGTTITDFTKTWATMDQAEQANVLHPSFSGDAIATASWVGAYITDSVQGISDSFTDILKQAYNYTDTEIGKLDAEAKYADFIDNVWHTYNVTNNGGYTPGTTAYETAYNQFYAYYKGESNVAPDGWTASMLKASENGNSLYNKSKSQYTFNVSEENGIVSTESRELPASYISSRVEVWGEKSSTIYNKEYVAFSTSLTDDIQSSGAVTSNDATEALIAIIKTKTYDNGIYIQSNDAADVEYEKLADYSKGALDAAVNGTASTDNIYFYNSETQAFESLSSAITAEYDWTYDPESSLQIDINHLTSISGTGTGRFIQLYKKVPGYLELDLNTIEWNNDFTQFASINDGKGGTHTNVALSSLYYVSGVVNPSVEGNLTDDATTDPRSTQGAVKYLSTNYKHHDYQSGMHGENSMEVTAYIVKAEDATPTNSGLADAYDMRSFVENFFGWVNISATTTTEMINTTSAFYDKVLWPLDSNGKPLARNLTAQEIAALGTLYYDNSTTQGVSNFVQASSGPAIGWKTVTHNGVSSVTYYFAKSSAENAEPASYYNRTEEAAVNPINLTLSRYTTKVYDIHY